MTYIIAKNKIETQETNYIKLSQQVKRLLGYNPLIGWNDIIVEYTKMGFVVVAEYDPTNDDFIVILDVFDTDGTLYKQIIQD